jgi:trehalose 6-phosphate synthase
LDEVGDKKALVFVQDYHLALVPHILKQQNPDLVVAQFWHIPWPDKEIMRICPWQREIVEGLLGNDLLGFHIRQHCQNFMDSVSGTLGGKISRTRQEIRNGDRRTRVLPFPISVDFDEISRNSEGDEVDREMRRLKETYKLSSDFIIVGLDRIDYTKGIPERFRALDQFLQRYSWYRGRVVLVQVGAPSRTDISVYRRLNEEIEGLAEEINERHGSDQWRPVVNITEQCAPITLAALRRMATAAVVTPLHDGMNLVAKEFVASRNDEDGVLILSCFAGAAEEMTDALLVNPYATEHLADIYKRALEMPRRERRTRMRRMRRVVQERNIYGWAADIIAQMISLKPGRW